MNIFKFISRFSQDIWDQFTHRDNDDIFSIVITIIWTLFASISLMIPTIMGWKLLFTDEFPLLLKLHEILSFIFSIHLLAMCLECIKRFIQIKIKKDN